MSLAGGLSLDEDDRRRPSGGGAKPEEPEEKGDAPRQQGRRWSSLKRISTRADYKRPEGHVPGRRVARYIRPTSSKTARHAHLAPDTAPERETLLSGAVPGLNAASVGAINIGQPAVGGCRPAETAAAASGGSRYLLGDSEDMVQRRRQMSIFTTITAVFYVLRFVMELEISASARKQQHEESLKQLFPIAAIIPAASKLFVKLLVAACGFYGARSRSQALTLLFGAGSLLFALKGVVMFSLLSFRVLGLRGDCQRAKETWVKLDCESVFHGKDKARLLIMGAETADVFLNVLACFFGKALLSLQRQSSRRLTFQDMPSGKFDDISPHEGEEGVHSPTASAEASITNGEKLSESP
eukprot:TRINITY_DN11485_c0_g1_i1.p1 TRINITY_DN11485_c0_g1~~TRINITY_DN11485_c0_g1_i1.p1  ORF type:complete len:355 (+),score=70.91 TRINITY_DN11485_c0_g1_i1:181-1245(+)